MLGGGERSEPRFQARARCHPEPRPCRPRRMTAALLKLGAAGNVKTQTLRAYNADEFTKILRNV